MVIPSWWYLALPSPHSHARADVAYTLGTAMAILGASVLLSRVPVFAWISRPVAVAGGMALTLYTAHLLFLATGALEELPTLRFLVMVAGALGFAVLWRRGFGQGSLERVVSTASQWARRITTELLATQPSPSGLDGNRLAEQAEPLLGEMTQAAPAENRARKSPWPGPTKISGHGHGPPG